MNHITRFFVFAATLSLGHCISYNHCFTDFLTAHRDPRDLGSFSTVSVRLPQGYHICNGGRQVSGTSVKVCIFFSECQEPRLDDALAHALSQSRDRASDLADVEVLYWEGPNLFFIQKHYRVQGIPLCADPVAADPQ